MKYDELGDRVKAFESKANAEQFDPHSFILARVDGRAFHTFTKGMAKPYDDMVFTAMIGATIAVSADLKPRLAFVQSDEATFCWHYPKREQVQMCELPFNGRVQKLCSLLAGAFSSAFLDTCVRQDAPRYLELNRVPVFDCRVWDVPTYKDQVDAFTWREKDAVKNAVSSAACTIATPKELEGLRHRERLALMAERGLDWPSFPNAYKHGAYVRRLTTSEPLDPVTWASIPEAKRPPAGTVVDRHRVAVDEQMLSIKQLGNPEEFFVNGAQAKLWGFQAGW